jgi:hypothetical protein
VIFILFEVFFVIFAESFLQFGFKYVIYALSWSVYFMLGHLNLSTMLSTNNLENSSSKIKQVHCFGMSQFLLLGWIIAQVFA